MERASRAQRDPCADPSVIHEAVEGYRAIFDDMAREVNKPMGSPLPEEIEEAAPCGFN